MTSQQTEQPCAAHETALIAMALGGPRAAGLDDHLAACPACRQKLRAYRHMRAGLLCGPTVAPAENLLARLTRLLRGRLRAANPRRRALHPLTHH